MCIHGPGWCPFYEYVTRPVRDPSAPLAGPRDVATEQIRPTSVRIAPDVELYSWRNEVVILPEGCPDSLQEQAEAKGRRILDFLKRARSERPHPRVLPATSSRIDPVTDRQSGTVLGAAEPDNGSGRHVRRSSP